jgi:hypothetical protein
MYCKLRSSPSTFAYSLTSAFCLSDNDVARGHATKSRTHLPSIITSVSIVPSTETACFISAAFQSINVSLSDLTMTPVRSPQCTEGKTWLYTHSDPPLIGFVQRKLVVKPGISSTRASQALFTVATPCKDSRPSLCPISQLKNRRYRENHNSPIRVVAILVQLGKTCSQQPVISIPNRQYRNIKVKYRIT